MGNCSDGAGHGRRQALTVAANKAVDSKDFVAECRGLLVTPHVAQNTSSRRSAIDARTTRHSGYALSQQVRKRVEEIFGWKRTVCGGRKLRYIGRRRKDIWMVLTVATYKVAWTVNLEVATRGGTAQRVAGAEPQAGEGTFTSP
jgi:hypothetical protein